MIPLIFLFFINFKKCKRTNFCIANKQLSFWLALIVVANSNCNSKVINFDCKGFQFSLF